MTDAYIDEYLRRLAGGEDPRRIERSLLAPDRQEILRRCAVPRTFDHETFVEVLRAGAGPEIEDLVREGYAEPVPGSRGLFRLRPDARSEWLEQWPIGARERVPAGVAAICARLGDWHAGRGDELEELYYRAVSDQERAVPLFIRLFAEADERFDLAAGQDVLDTVSEPGRLQWLGPWIAELRADRHAYLRARSYWSTDWLQSARYLDRPALFRRLAGLVAGRGGRVLQLHAPGGSGKTMLLRWFIARWCVPEPRRIPCARIDFDVFAVAAAGRHPWLLLLELADQLNRQLPNAPFQELLNDRGVLRALLDPRPSGGLLSAAGQLGSDPRHLAEEVVERFIRTVAETAGDRPVLLVFDTFEQVLLSPDGDAAAVLGLLAEVSSGCPSVRLLVAGRYDLRERVPDLADLLPGLGSATIASFSATEARSYLRKRRGLADPDLIDAMVTKGRGNPFVLALLADLAGDREGLTAEEVLAYDDPEALYLVERIVSRVSEPAVRWLLRYGVVPRHLSRDFVTDVMAPFLRQGMSGTTTADTPVTDDLPDAAAGELFPTDLLPSRDAPLDLDNVWHQLLQYAAESSWVSRQDGSSDVVAFHPELIHPMRRVLRDHAVFRKLHGVAATYCAGQAELTPDAWMFWTVEAVYHRFQAGAADAGDAWRSALEDAGDRFGVEARARLADEVLGPEYVDERGEPRPFDDRRLIVGWDILARAYFERAGVLVSRAEGVPEAAAVGMAHGALRQLHLADLIGEEHGWPDAPMGELVILTAKAQRLAGNPSAARSLAASALQNSIDPADRAALMEVLADAASSRAPEEAIYYYYSILTDREIGQSPGRVRVSRKLGTLLSTMDRSSEALHLLRGMPSPAQWTEADAVALVEDARIWLQAGRPDELLERLRRAGPWHPDGTHILAFAWCRAAARLALHEPFGALEICEEAMDRRQPPAGVELRLHLELAELHAMINATVLRLNEAFAELEYVTAGWREAGEIERSWMAAGAPADFDLRGGETLRRHAEYLVHGAGDAEEQPGGEGWFRRRLSELRLKAEKDEPLLPSDYEQTIAALGPGVPPHSQAQLGLVVLPVDPVAGVRMLLGGLRRIDSTRARLGVLTPLRRSERVTLIPEERAELVELVGPQPSPSEPALILLWIEFHRVLGDRSLATAALHEAAEHLLAGHGGSDLLFRRWLVLDAAGRLGDVDLALPDTTGDDVLRRSARRNTPVLGAAILVLWALRNPSHEAVESWLDEAQRLLSNGGAGGSEWEVHLHIGRALAALERGDSRRGEEHLLGAELIWERIHPRRPLPSGRRLVARRRPEGSDDLPLGAFRPIGQWAPDQFVYAIARTGRSFTVTTRARDRVITQSFDQLGLGSVPRDHEPLSAQLDMLVSGLLTPGHEQGGLLRLLFDGFPRRDVRAPGARENVAIQTESTLVAALPWEFAAHGAWAGGTDESITRVSRDPLVLAHTIAGLQRCLRVVGSTPLQVDGLEGPVTRGAAEEFTRRTLLPGWHEPITWTHLYEAFSRARSGRPEVLVIRPSTTRELSHGRGGLSEGVDVADLYERRGYAVKVVTNAGAEVLTRKIRDTAAGGRFAVIHVAGGFGSSAHEVYVETGHGSSSALSGTTFDRAFASLPPELPRPLVILDPGRPQGRSEAMRQLVLRNAFAHQLLELGNIPVVLAMGLDHDPYERRHSLIDTLAAGGTADTAACLLRRHEDMLASSVVVATHLPPYAMPRWPTA